MTRRFVLHSFLHSITPIVIAPKNGARLSSKIESYATLTPRHPKRTAQFERCVYSIRFFFLTPDYIAIWYFQRDCVIAPADINDPGVILIIQRHSHVYTRALVARSLFKGWKESISEDFRFLTISDAWTKYFTLLNNSYQLSFHPKRRVHSYVLTYLGVWNVRDNMTKPHIN